jgi:hypothetical protein
MLKEHYNEHYETVVDELNNFYKKRLLELPEKIDGFSGFHPSLNIGSICDNSQNACIPFACSSEYATPNLS